MDKNKLKIERLNTEIFKPKIVFPDYAGELKRISDRYYESIMTPIRKFSKISQVISDNLDYYSNIEKAFKDIFNFDFIEIVKNHNTSFSSVILDNIRFLGGRSWCLYDIEEFDKSSKSLLLIVEKMETFLQNEGVLGEDIDSYIGNEFSIDMLKSIKNKITIFLEEEDKVKLNKAFMHLNNGDFMESALLLMGLIDAQNIKQELYDISIKNIKYTTDPNPKASQGWKSFYRSFRNNLMGVFNGNEIIKNKSNNSKSILYNFAEDIKKDKTYDLNVISPIYNLIYGLMVLFYDSDWSDYPNNKPKILNRHWLMHGMYSVDDIKKYDCIKLLLLLYQLTLLYKKIRNQEI